MDLDHVFKKTSREMNENSRRRAEVPEGLLCKCSICGKGVLAEEVRSGSYICPKCGGYFRMKAPERIRSIADAGTFEEWDREVSGFDPIHFEGYKEKLAASKLKSRLKEAVVTGRCQIDGEDCVLCVMDGRFMMGSMGEAVGEKITRAAERATLYRLPLIIFTCSGGARMQEGIISLMQMSKISGAIRRHDMEGLLYICVLTDPTTGGVTASFAMQADIILSEPGALIGFAGPRVIEQTIRQKLPKGFQKAEFLLKHGFVDAIATRTDMKRTLVQLIRENQSCGKILFDRISEQPDRAEHGESSESTGDAAAAGEQLTGDNSLTESSESTGDAAAAGEQLTGDNSLTESSGSAGGAATAWERVQLSRDKKRPTASDYIAALFSEFFELHGDRRFGDDAAVLGGLAFFEGIPVTVIAQEKGKNTKKNLEHNFGMCSPEGYRKALRLIHQAEKFGRPVLFLVDTPGAFCGVEAEERGQGQAIAECIYELTDLQVPVLSVVIGEGGSGGALAFAHADEVWMLENAVYSILSPEGFAAILWKDSRKAEQAAESMKLTACDLYQMGIIEKVIPEPETLTPDTMEDTVEKLRSGFREFINRYLSMTVEELQESCIERFRKM